MHILHVYKTYFPDTVTGIERVIFEIAEGGTARGSTHEVLCLSPLPEPVALTVGSHRVHRVRQDLMIASNGLSLSVIGLYRRLWRDADLIHFHYPWPMMDLLHLTQPRRATKPIVVTYHSDVVRQRMLGRLYTPLRDWFLGSADAVVATSQNYAASSEVLRGHREKLSIIPVGLGDRATPDASVVETMRQRVGERFFLFVGAPRYYKGLPSLFEAARLTGLPVVLAGASRRSRSRSAAAGRYGPRTRQRDREGGAARALLLALVLPSHLRSEAYGVVLVEAARAGRPMISCEIGTGTSFVNRDGETGLVVAPADAAALADAMRRLDTDRAFAEGCGIGARARYEQHLRAAQMVEAYEHLYEELLARATARHPPAAIITSK